MALNVTKGKTPVPPKMVIYGTEGIGKSSLASSFPNPVFVQTEDGLNQIDTSKFELSRTFADVMQNLNALLTEEHDFQTVVVDSISGLEPLLWKDLCDYYGAKSIEAVGGGYGKGYTIANDWWRKFLAVLDELNRKRNMVVILIAHAKVERFEDPENTSYDMYVPRMHARGRELVTMWADAVLQAKLNYRVQTTKEGFGAERTIAKSMNGGERVLRCVGSPSSIAKNRFGMPNEIPMDYAILMNYLTGATDNGKQN